MNKSEFVRAISEHAGITLKDAEIALNAVIDVTTSTLSKGEEITLTGFGSFSVTERSARMGMDFKTKKVIEIPASRCVKFKPGKTLKESVQ